MRWCSELGVEFLDLLGFGVCLRDPFDHRRVHEHRVTVARAIGVEGYVVALKTCADRREHSVGRGWSRTKQERTAVAPKAVTPDRRDAVDVGLCARPSGKAGVARANVHW